MLGSRQAASKAASRCSVRMGVPRGPKHCEPHCRCRPHLDGVQVASGGLAAQPRLAGAAAAQQLDGGVGLAQAKLRACRRGTSEAAAAAGPGWGARSAIRRQTPAQQACARGCCGNDSSSRGSGGRPCVRQWPRAACRQPAARPARTWRLCERQQARVADQVRHRLLLRLAEEPAGAAVARAVGRS